MKKYSTWLCIFVTTIMLVSFAITLFASTNFSEFLQTPLPNSSAGFSPGGNLDIGTANVTTLNVSGVANFTGTMTGDGSGLTITGWTSVPNASFNTTPATNSTISTFSNLVSTIPVGSPMSYVIDGTTYYGQLVAINSTLLTIAGAALTGNITSLKYGKPEKITQMVIAVPSTYESVSMNTLVANLVHSNIVWQKVKGYLVRYTMWSETADSAGDGKASVRINGAETNLSANGLTIAANSTAYSTGPNIDTTAYDINYGELIELTAVKGTGGNATYLVSTLIFVIP